jgi:hypothetical protein
MNKPCTPQILEFQCAGDEKKPDAGCGFMWLSVPWKDFYHNAFCPNCGNYSPWDADLAFSVSDESCVESNEE